MLVRLRIPHRAVPDGEKGIGRPDCPHHFALRRESVDVRPVLVADPERAVCTENQALAVHRHPPATRTLPTKPISDIRRSRQRRKPRERHGAHRIGIQPCHRLAIRGAEQHRVEVLEVQVRLRRAKVGGREAESQLVHAWIVV